MKLRAFLLLLLSAAAGHAEKIVLRVGYFPNITHAQGVIGSQASRTGHGWFEQRLGPDVTVQWFAFNAGPSAMEAIFAGSIDLTYVGPNPAPIFPGMVTVINIRKGSPGKGYVVTVTFL